MTLGMSPSVMDGRTWARRCKVRTGLHSEGAAASGPEVAEPREKRGSLTPSVFLLPSYRLPETTWQSLKINELCAFLFFFFFLQGFALKGFCKGKKKWKTNAGGMGRSRRGNVSILSSCVCLAAHTPCAGSSAWF